MATKPRDWPNNAKNARDRTSEELQRILREARRLREITRKGSYTRVELAFIAGDIIDATQTALRHLEQQGAQTQPD